MQMSTIRNNVRFSLGYRLFRIAIVFLVLAFVVPSIPFAQESPPTEALEPGWSNRVEELAQAGDFTSALQLVDRAIAHFPDQGHGYLIRGMVKFRAEDVAGSIADFEKSIALDPQSEPYCWQLGISYYYAGRCKEGRDLFVDHRTVNPNDAENAFWHYLCVAKLEGAEKAAQQLLPCGKDTRPPLMDVLDLIAGKKSAADIEALIENSRGTERAKSSTRFYGYLYLGLYYEAVNQRDLSRNYLDKCLQQKVQGYMADVARVHLKILK
jgi:lipoprotein NlpI